MKKDKRPVGRPKGPTSGWKNLFIQISPSAHKKLQREKIRAEGIGRFIDRIIKEAR